MTKKAPALFALALLVILTLQWITWSPGLPLISAANPSVGAAQSDEGASPDPLSQLKAPEERESFASVIERPLFRPDRKPEPPIADEKGPQGDPEAAAALETMDLTAVLISPTATTAWVKDPKQPKLRRLRIGDDFDGWAVREIRDDRVVLERQGDKDELLLRDFSKTPPPAATPRSVPRRPHPTPKPVPPPPAPPNE